MKICIPTDGNEGLKATVSEHFGRAPYFTVIDDETMTARAVENKSEHMGGSGLPPEHIAAEKVDIMLCAGMGFRAVQLFKNYGIDVYVGARGTAEEAIDKWKKGEIQPASSQNTCAEHGH